MCCLMNSAILGMGWQGPHLLAPTGSDLSRYGKLNSVFAGYHYDLNFLTIHGRSRFPGLFIWLKNGRKVAVKVPEGCLLLQAGKQVSGKVLRCFVDTPLDCSEWHECLPFLSKCLLGVNDKFHALSYPRDRYTMHQQVIKVWALLRLKSGKWKILVCLGTLTLAGAEPFRRFKSYQFE